MAPKELEKILYFAASIVTWVDQEARLARHPGPARPDAGGARPPRGGGERARRRAAHLARGAPAVPDRRLPGDFGDEDHLWAEALDINVKKLDDDERAKLLKELRKTFEADIADTEAYIEDAIERMRSVWDLFRDMEPQKIEHDETIFRELKDRFGSPYGFGEYFRGGMGAEAIRDLLEQVDLDAEAADLEEQVKTGKGQKQARAVKRLKVVDAFRQSGNRPTR
jgi:DNA-directed RNA polymerase subunit beta'